MGSGRERVLWVSLTPCSRAEGRSADEAWGCGSLAPRAPHSTDKGPHHAMGDTNGWATIASGTDNVLVDVLTEWDTSGLRPCS